MKRNVFRHKIIFFFNGTEVSVPQIIKHAFSRSFATSLLLLRERCLLLIHRKFINWILSQNFRFEYTLFLFAIDKSIKIFCERLYHNVGKSKEILLVYWSILIWYQSAYWSLDINIVMKIAVNDKTQKVSALYWKWARPLFDQICIRLVSEKLIVRVKMKDSQSLKYIE